MSSCNSPKPAYVSPEEALLARAEHFLENNVLARNPDIASPLHVGVCILRLMVIVLRRTYTDEISGNDDLVAWCRNDFPAFLVFMLERTGDILQRLYFSGAKLGEIGDLRCGVTGAIADPIQLIDEELTTLYRRRASGPVAVLQLPAFAGTLVQTGLQHYDDFFACIDRVLFESLAILTPENVRTTARLSTRDHEAGAGERKLAPPVAQFTTSKKPQPVPTGAKITSTPAVAKANAAELSYDELVAECDRLRHEYHAAPQRSAQFILSFCVAAVLPGPEEATPRIEKMHAEVLRRLYSHLLHATNEPCHDVHPDEVFADAKQRKYPSRVVRTENLLDSMFPPVSATPPVSTTVPKSPLLEMPNHHALTIPSVHGGLDILPGGSIPEPVKKTETVEEPRASSVKSLRNIIGRKLNGEGAVAAQNIVVFSKSQTPFPGGGDTVPTPQALPPAKACTVPTPPPLPPAKAGTVPTPPPPPPPLPSTKGNSPPTPPPLPNGGGEPTQSSSPAKAGSGKQPPKQPGSKSGMSALLDQIRERKELKKVENPDEKRRRQEEEKKRQQEEEKKRQQATKDSDAGDWHTDSNVNSTKVTKPVVNMRGLMGELSAVLGRKRPHLDPNAK